MKNIGLGVAAAFLAVVCSVAKAQEQGSAVDDAMVKAVDAETPAAIALLEQIVNINSGTMNLPGVVAVKDVIAPQLEATGIEAIVKAAKSLLSHPSPFAAEGRSSARR